MSWSEQKSGALGLTQGEIAGGRGTRREVPRHATAM